MKKYEWLPESNAPHIYPTRIHNGHLYLEDGDQVYIPTSGTNDNGWGRPGATHIQGEDLKAVPIKLELEWAAYSEFKFYKGSWDLPVEKIKALFEKGAVDWQSNTNLGGYIIRIGCAPGGMVVVWFSGDSEQIEIGRFQGTETDISMKDLVPGNPTISKKEYFDDRIDPKYAQEFKERGIDYKLFDTYRNKYEWRATATIPNHTLSNLFIEMYNGEKEGVMHLDKNKNEFKKRAIPYYFYYVIDDKDKKQHVFLIEKLDEKEIFELFTKANPNKPIEIVLKMDEKLNNRQLLFKQDNEEFLIKKVNFETWIYEKFKP